MSYAYWEQTRVRQEPAPAVAPSRTESRRAAAPDRPTGGRSLVQIFAGVFGAVFALTGILGFVPGITSMYGDLGFAGRGSHAELLGLFQISVAHNIVHLLFGVGLLAARKASTARLYLIVGGALYLVVGLYGSIIDRGGAANFLPFNYADNVLHFGLSLTMVALGIVGGVLYKRSRATA